MTHDRFIQVQLNCKETVGFLFSVSTVEFCKGARQSGLVSVWQHTLVTSSGKVFYKVEVVAA